MSAALATKSSLMMNSSKEAHKPKLKSKFNILDCGGPAPASTNSAGSTKVIGLKRREIYLENFVKMNMKTEQHDAAEVYAQEDEGKLCSKLSTAMDNQAGRPKTAIQKTKLRLKSSAHNNIRGSHMSNTDTYYNRNLTS